MNYRRILYFALLIAGVVSLILPLSARAEVETFMIDKVHSKDSSFVFQSVGYLLGCYRNHKDRS
jgi:hypothetical protein